MVVPLCVDIIFCAQVKLVLPLPARPWDVASKRRKIWKDRRDKVVTAGKGEITGVEGCSFSIIQSDNMPLSWNSETLPYSLELGRLAGKRIMQDDGICHNLHCPGKIRFDRAMHGGACHVPRAGHRGSLAEMIFAICASVVKASQPICQKMWGRDSWRQQGILPNAMKIHAPPSLFIHSPALVWHSTQQQQTILIHQLLKSIFYFLFDPISSFQHHKSDSKFTQERNTNRIKTSCILCLGILFMMVERCIYLLVHSCLLAFKCVSLSIQQSGSPDLGYSDERQLLTTKKLNRTDMTVLLFHTVQCLWSGHVEGRHTGTTENTHKLREGGGWGKASVPVSDWPHIASTMAHCNCVIVSILLDMSL